MFPPEGMAVMTEDEEKNWTWVLMRWDGPTPVYWHESGPWRDLGQGRHFETKADAELQLANLPRDDKWTVQPGHVK